MLSKSEWLVSICRKLHILQKMSPSTRGTRTTRVRKSSRTSTRIALPRARVVLERMNLEQTIELQDSPNPQEATRDNQANVSSSTPRTSARHICLVYCIINLFNNFFVFYADVEEPID